MSPFWTPKSVIFSKSYFFKIYQRVSLNFLLLSSAFGENANAAKQYFNLYHHKKNSWGEQIGCKIELPRNSDGREVGRRVNLHQRLRQFVNLRRLREHVHTMQSRFSDCMCLQGFMGVSIGLTCYGPWLVSAYIVQRQRSQLSCQRTVVRTLKAATFISDDGY